MNEFSLYVLDITMNSVRAGATEIEVKLEEKGDMLYFSVSNDDKFVIIVFVQRSMILITPIKIDPLLWKGHIDVEYFIFDECVCFLCSHRKNLVLFDESIP